MLKSLVNVFALPKLWLTVGLVLVCSCLAIGYYQDQKLADLTLAHKVGLPDPVFLQDLELDRDVNNLHEVYVLAEIDASTIWVRPIGDEETAKSMLFVPAYPVSTEGQMSAARALKEYAPDFYASIRRGETDLTQSSTSMTPEAVFVFEFFSEDDSGDINIARDLGMRQLGQGDHGDIVAVAGSLLRRPLWTERQSRLFEQGLSRYFDEASAKSTPIIAPYRLDAQLAAAPDDLSEIRDLHLSIGVLALAIAAMLFLGLPKTKKRRFHPISVADSKAEIENADDVPYFHPLASQDEILTDELLDEQSENPSILEKASEGLGRVVSQLTSLKSRQ